MKFNSVVSFEKHLEASYPNLLSHLFLLVSPCPYEKKMWSQLILTYFAKKDPLAYLTSFHAPSTPLSNLLDEIQTPHLWNPLKIVVIHDIDQMKPPFSYESLKPLCHEQTVLIFFAQSFKGIGQWYQQAKKEIIILDTSEEKPWEKEKRTQEWITAQLKKQGKTLSAEGASFLIRLLGTDLATVDQELCKLITYMGEKSVIQREDIEAVICVKDLITSWALAETVVWHHPISLKDKGKDMSFILPFLGQIRYQLQIGLRLAELHLRQVPLAHQGEYFPSIRPSHLNKLSTLAMQKKHSFFLQGILKLYELEVSLKTTSIPLDVSFDFFQAALYEKPLT
ncbi:MAG: hypothetical protein QRY72_01675 [Candidatus Rhabdochlamydia sp.]